MANRATQRISGSQGTRRLRMSMSTNFPIEEGDTATAHNLRTWYEVYTVKGLSLKETISTVGNLDLI